MYTELQIYKRRFVNELPDLMNYPITIELSDNIIYIKFVHKNINVVIYITNNYPWKVPKIKLNNISYSNYIKSNILINKFMCLDCNLLYSDYIKLNLSNIHYLSGQNNKCLHCKSVTNIFNWYTTRKLYEVIDEIYKYIDYKQQSTIMIMIRVIKRKYLNYDIPIENFFDKIII